MPTKQDLRRLVKIAKQVAVNAELGNVSAQLVDELSSAVDPFWGEDDQAIEHLIDELTN